VSAHPTHKRQAIANMKAALVGITQANSRLTDVATVREYAMEWETSRPDGPLPWLGMFFGRVRVEPKSFDVFDCFLPVDVVCHVTAATRTAALDTLEDLLDDIIVAVLADPRRGVNTNTGLHNAITTKYLGEEHDASDPDGMDSRGGTGTMIVHFEIKYQRGTTAQATEGE
jgi:hypothetical protein